MNYTTTRRISYEERQARITDLVNNRMNKTGGLYQVDATVTQVVQYLARGSDEVEIIDNLLVVIRNQQDMLEDRIRTHLDLSPMAPLIIEPADVTPQMAADFLEALKRPRTMMHSTVMQPGRIEMIRPPFWTRMRYHAIGFCAGVIAMIIFISLASCTSRPEPAPAALYCWKCHVTNSAVKGDSVIFGDAVEDVCAKTPQEIRAYEAGSYVKKWADGTVITHLVKCQVNEKVNPL